MRANKSTPDVAAGRKDSRPRFAKWQPVPETREFVKVKSLVLSKVDRIAIMCRTQYGPVHSGTIQYEGGIRPMKVGAHEYSPRRCSKGIPRSGIL